MREVGPLSEAVFFLFARPPSCPHHMRDCLNHCAKTGVFVIISMFPSLTFVSTRHIQSLSLLTRVERGGHEQKEIAPIDQCTFINVSALGFVLQPKRK